MPASCIPMELFTYNFYALKIVSDVLVALVNKMQIKMRASTFKILLLTYKCRTVCNSQASSSMNGPHLQTPVG